MLILVSSSPGIIIMGVHGITKLLEEQEILPPPSEECCSIKLWKEWNPSMAFWKNGPQLTVLPPHSKLFIDGNGLVFHLHNVAYARHVQSTFASQRGGAKNCPKLHGLSDIDIATALPSMMPLDLVRQVTQEFVTTLVQLDMTLTCYWDGPALGRGFKLKTLQKRANNEGMEWASLQTFCRHGTVPMKPSDTICQCLWHFPFARHFLHTVKHTLRSCSVEMIQCDGEADPELARAARGNPDIFVLGQDSDFLFYEGIQYVPLGGIYLSTGSNACVQVVCLTRRHIATALGLEDEDMVELAILLGNDYVDSNTLQVPSDVRSVKDRILYLQQHADEDFLVQSKNLEAPELDFVRNLYNMRDDVDGSLRDDDSSKDDDDDDDDDTSGEEDSAEDIELQVVPIPKDFPLALAQASVSDTSLRDVVTRCLQAFADQCVGSEAEREMILTQAHVDAYLEATRPSISPLGMHTSVELSRRPPWDDVCAAFLIEQSISRALRVTTESFLVSTQTPPHTLMNHLKFHQFLAGMVSNVDGEESRGSLISNDSPPMPAPMEERPVLPIDEHQDTILSTIQRNRVTIIHGETGCGKSSRVPVMILERESPEPSLPRVKIFVSQPRRIAAASLVERVRSCEPEHRDKFALRMGHGIKEYETSQTQAWFVTTGYLTRLLANHPERFDNVTHLIVDEVHERSVDTDILCLLCRRLLETNKTIRLVLMSATMASKLYQDYFDVPNDPIHVGVRRFPIKEFFVEDLQHLGLPPTEVANATAIQKECETKRCRSAPSQTEMSKRISLAARLASLVGVAGSSVLIFVPGMGEIIAITEAIEKMYRPGITYICYPIHSDIPFEEQMGAFNAPEPNEVKVIIATNAAESSVTLPAVDHVICLGLCRQIMYNKLSHRQILQSCWISKASATQRAGRTGRLRPGNVYRLYTRHAYENNMDEFEQGEMLRIPLDSVILMLKEILQHEEVKPVLLSCIEPPPMETIDKSFESLYHWNFLSEPSDSSQITSLGCFVSALGIDLALGFFIGLGIQFGVAAEAIEMAAIMAFPKSPFQISNPLIHSVSKYNESTAETYVSRCHFDANLYSEPLALMNALWDYHIATDRFQWCSFYRFAHARLRQLHSTRDNLRRRVALFLGINETRLQVAVPPVHMPHYKLTILRILKVWVFSDNILEAKASKVQKASNGTVTLSIPKNQPSITEAMLDQVLMKPRHPYKILERRSIGGVGTFETDGTLPFADSVEQTLQSRFVSYMCVVGIDVAILEDSQCTYAYFRNDLAEGAIMSSIFQIHSDHGCLLQAEQDSHPNPRGILERRCGRWKVTSTTGEDLESLSSDEHQQLQVFRRVSMSGGKELSTIASRGIATEEINSLLIFRILGKRKKKLGNSFTYTLKGQCQDISKVDLKDLLAAQSVEVLDMRTTSGGQSINFLETANKPRAFKAKGSIEFATSLSTEASSWARPMFTDVPEGARILSVLASGFRKGDFLRFPDKNADEEGASIEICLAPEDANIGKRWRRLGVSGMAYVQADTVPASATTCEFPILACCSNTLETGGGSIRAEGMTILPSNPLFLLLCRLSFGLGPDVDKNFGSMAKLSSGEEVNETTLITQAKAWLKDRLSKFKLSTENSNSRWVVDQSMYESTEKIVDALAFNKSCGNMGERLVCFPERTRALVELFNGVDQYETAVDDLLEERGLTPENLAVWRREAKCVVDPVEKHAGSTEEVKCIKSTQKGTPGRKSASTTGSRNGDVATKKNQKSAGSSALKKERGFKEETLPTAQVQLPAPPSLPQAKWTIVRNFDEDTNAKVAGLFVTDLNGDQKGETILFPSTNILALLVQEYVLQMSTIEPSSPLSPKQDYSVLVPKNWEILSLEDASSAKKLYIARYRNRALPVMPLTGRGKNKLPKWMKSTDMRPKRVEDAQPCVPPSVSVPEPRLVNFSKNRQGLAYESIEAALQMEAAFFLERQFSTASKTSTRHWFQHTLGEMIQILSHNSSAAASNP